MKRVLTILLLIFVILMASCYSPDASPPRNGTQQNGSSHNGSSKFPKFPWPPPRASAMVNLPNEFFIVSEANDVYFRDIDSRLSSALSDAGYIEKSYYAVPSGFALVARMEQINPDGTSKSGSARWAIDVGSLRDFSLSAYLRALFTSDPGYFRIIVFVITPLSFSQSNVYVSRQEAIDWLPDGSNRLPRDIGDRLYSKEHLVTALIYEFEKERGAEKADTLIPGRLSAMIHLEKSMIMTGLRRK